MQRLAVTIAACVAAAALPAGAPAATLDYTAGSGPDPGEYIVYTGVKGEANRLKVVEGKGKLTFVDPGAKRITKKRGSFRGCTFSVKKRVVCKVDPRIDLVIELGDGNDSLAFSGKRNGTTYGPASTSRARTVGALAERYIDLQGANEQHLLVTGGAGDDKLKGTRYDDVIDPGAGSDTVDGGAGADHLNNKPDEAADKFLGGGGFDTIDGAGPAALTIDLDTQTFGAGTTEIDSLDSIERARGGDGNDTLSGSSGRDGLFGDGGDDQLDGRTGDDYLSGDLESRFDSGAQGRDTLTGGPGDDILDGREDPPFDFKVQVQKNGLRADSLLCGDGADLIEARTDDLPDSSCEASAFGVFSGDLYLEQYADFTAATTIAPVARAADGAPTYSVACPANDQTKEPCTVRVQLEDPPVEDATTAPRVLGTASAEIPRGGRQNVAVVLNDAGKAALAQPGAPVSVRVLAGFNAEPRANVPFSADADFGWRQPSSTP